MGCAPQPRKSEKIAKTNAEPSRRNLSTLNKENQHETQQVMKMNFEDIANNDFSINQERRVNNQIEKMDFVNKCR